MNSFTSIEEKLWEKAFLENGYVIFPAEHRLSLERLKALVNPHEPVVDRLNELKLHIMKRLNETEGTREAYFRLAQNMLYAIVGNELAMQKKFNINVQVPNDERNLLPIHADTWTGDSPFQVVVWVPLVDCYRTKSLWLLPPSHAKDFHLDGNSEIMFRKIEPHIKYLEVKYGEVLMFNSTLPHGNRVNREDSTRWTINCRFKSVFSPYAKKGLGEHFEPITLKPASKVGLAYRHPV